LPNVIGSAFNQKRNYFLKQKTINIFYNIDDKYLLEIFDIPTCITRTPDCWVGKEREKKIYL
jgi:hypothetical protein